jgi:hypothetical protein
MYVWGFALCKAPFFVRRSEMTSIEVMEKALEQLVFSICELWKYDVPTVSRINTSRIIIRSLDHLSQGLSHDEIRELADCINEELTILYKTWEEKTNA